MVFYSSVQRFFNETLFGSSKAVNSSKMTGNNLMIVTQADLRTSHPHTMNIKICVSHVTIMPADIGISTLVPHFLCIHELTTV